MNGDKIIQINGFGVKNIINTQCNFLICALTDNGKVLISEGWSGIWDDITPQEKRTLERINDDE